MWLIYAICAAMIWGVNYALSEKVFQYKIKPVTLLALQAMTGVLLYAILSLFVPIKRDLQVICHNKNLLLVTGGTILAYLAANLLISFSIYAKNATVAGIIELTYPLFTIIFSWILFRASHVNFAVVIGGIFIIIGVIIIGLFSSS